jgi:hypothetical protein
VTELTGVFASQYPMGGPATPAFGMTISTVSFGEKAMAALNSWTTASHDVTSVLTNFTLLRDGFRQCVSSFLRFLSPLFFHEHDIPFEFARFSFFFFHIFGIPT